MVIFDFDGVIVDSEPPTNALLAAMFSRCGARMDAEEAMRRFIGLPHEECRRLVEHDFGLRLPEGFDRDYRQALEPLYRERVAAVPGIHALVSRLRAPYAIASGSATALIRLGLARIGLEAAFAGRIFSAGDEACGKPHPDVYLRAIAALGVPAERGVAVEDSVVGVQSARAAGLTVFGLAGSCAAAALEAAGAIAVTGLAELDHHPSFRRAAGLG